jgi:uncharacterized protein YjbJ (UPF0337 family)
MRPSPITRCYGGTRPAQPDRINWRCAVDDKARGELQKAEGKVKEEFGKVVGDRSTELGGKVDQLKGQVQSKVGDVKMEAEREAEIDETASR